MANNSGGKQRKFGRNKTYCTAYKNSQRRLKNKARRMVRALKRSITVNQPGRFVANHQLARDILRHDKDTLGFSVGADVRMLCTRAIETHKESVAQRAS